MRTWAIGLALCVATAAWGIEEYVPSAQPTLDVVSGYRITQFEIQMSPDGQSQRVNLTVVALRADGECAKDSRGACTEIKHSYHGGFASQVIKAVNSGTYGAAGTLSKAILSRLAAEELLPAGSVSGTPGVPDLPTPAPTPTGGIDLGG